jgi:hypothetical protein
MASAGAEVGFRLEVEAIMDRLLQLSMVIFGRRVPARGTQTGVKEKNLRG